METTVITNPMDALEIIKTAFACLMLAPIVLTGIGKILAAR
jgi:hypothetical protein